MTSDDVNAANEKAEIEEAILLAKKMNVVLYELIEPYKGRAHILAKAHLIIAHAMLRQSTCCIPSLSTATMGVWSMLEQVINEGHYELPDGPPIPGGGH